ncbi:MAG: metalloregulator ArsR/SmtB family transcription factor [Pseudomonadota bacterium]
MSKGNNNLNLIPFDALAMAAECLKCIAHPHRLRIIELLLLGEFNVDQITEKTGLSQPVTSGHLRLMHGKGLLASERRNRSVYYSVKNPQLKNIIQNIRSSAGTCVVNN